MSGARKQTRKREGPLDEDNVEPGEDALFSFETPFRPAPSKSGWKRRIPRAANSA